MSCVLLAVALVCTPGSAAMGRVRRLWPRRRPTTVSPYGTAVLPVVAGLVVGLAAAGPGGAVVAALGVVLVRGRRARRRAETSAAAATAELAAALERITDELRAGSHPADALDGARADGPWAREVLGAAAGAARLGEPVSAALAREAGSRTADAIDLDRVVRAWQLSERHGIPLVELLAEVGSDLRWRARFSGQVRALLAGPRATAAVLTALPLIGLLLGQLVGADPIAVLRGSGLGQALLVGGTGLTAAGTLWADHILRAAAPR